MGRTLLRSLHNKLLSVSMKSIYSASLGILTTIYVVLFVSFAHSLYLDVTIAPKIEACKSFLGVKSCDFVAYFFLGYMESLQVLCGLTCSILTLVLLGKLTNLKLSREVIALSYLVSSLLYLLAFREFNQHVFNFVISTVIVYSTFYWLIIKVLIHLTSHSSRTNNSWLLLLRRLF